MEQARRRELKAQFKQVKTYMGIIQITSQENGKIFIEGYPNLKNKWLTIKMQLDLGSFYNLDLQKDWKAYGEQAFQYEVLEQKETEKMTDVRWEVKKLKKVWFTKLEPYDDKGYNRPLKD